MVKKSIIFPLIVILTAISWLDGKRIVSQEYWYRVFDDRGTSSLPNGQSTNQYWDVIHSGVNPIVGFSRGDYTHVPKGTEFENFVNIQVLIPSRDGKVQHFSNQTRVYKFSYDNVPIIFDYEYRPPVEVVIPPQPVPEELPEQFPFVYVEQEPLTVVKKVEQKNFNVDRYYLLEGTDSFDGVCNIILKIRWNFALNTLPVNQVNQTQFCVFSVNGIVTIHDSYIQNQPIEDGAYIHEFSHFNVDQGNIIYANSEQINNGRFFYNYDNDITVNAIYNTISVVSGASVTSVRNFDLKVPVYENFTFK